MNRRVTLIDAIETPDFQAYFGIGLGEEIYTIQQLMSLNDYEREEILRFGEGDGILLVGKNPFLFLQERYHFGIRSENYADCASIDRVSIEGGAFIKVVLKVPKKDVVDAFMSPDFAKKVDWRVEQKVLHTYKEVMKYLDWLKMRPDGSNNPNKFTWFSLDYEASGMPLDKEFEMSGASICAVPLEKYIEEGTEKRKLKLTGSTYVGFISFTDLRNNSTEDQYSKVLRTLGEFLEKNQRRIWVYNMQYEFLVSHRMLGVTLYNLCDASVFNTLDGYHLKKYSLKFTAMRVLFASVWDTEFDRISELVEKMLFEVVGKTKKDRQRILKPYILDYYEGTPEWAEICQRYPNYIDEFKKLIAQYQGNPFMCIPSDILGYYCNLDAFYTAMIAVVDSQNYSIDATETFLDNGRLGSLLHSSGLYIDEAFRLQYKDECAREMAWGITYCAEARCMVNMNKLKNKMSKLSKFHPIVQKLLKENKFFGGDILEITKHILTTNLDKGDSYELGLNEAKLFKKYGDEFAESFLALVRASMIEVKMIKTPRATKANPNPQPVVAMKIDDSVKRKKKILDLISKGLQQILDFDNIKFDARFNNLETYLRYESIYKDLMKISKEQLNDRNHMPTEIHYQGMTMDLLSYSDFVSDNFFKCKSPIENDAICLEFATDYRAESSYLAAIFESTQQLDGTDKFYKNRGITNPNDAFAHFMSNWERYVKSNGQDLGEYPKKVYDLAATYYNDLKSDAVKDVWSNFNGFIAQEQFFEQDDKSNIVVDQYAEYGKVFNPNDLNDNLFFMRKLVVNYLRYKKYAKVLSTYIDGMFKKNNVWVIEGPDHIPLRYADPNEPGAVEKCMVHYEVNTKSSKRWSSGFHTIISHADLKDCITTPPAFYVDPRTGEVIRDCDYFLTYFDISSAEVKAAGFASGDPELIRLFREGIDVNYIASPNSDIRGFNLLKCWKLSLGYQY